MVLFLLCTMALSFNFAASTRIKADRGSRLRAYPPSVQAFKSLGSPRMRSPLVHRKMHVRASENESEGPARKKFGLEARKAKALVAVSALPLLVAKASHAAAENDSGFLPDLSSWIAAAFLVMGVSLMFEAVKSGGLAQDLEKIKNFFVERMPKVGGEGGEDSKLARRREEWMNKIAEADKPKKADARTEKDKSRDEGEIFISDLDSLFDEIKDLEKKSGDNTNNT
ncbi:hypothetical protein AAMO2058_000711700 [Amorphochlora amoebiformis]